MNMTMEEKNKLRKAGIEVDDAIKRFLGNEDLYRKFLFKFSKDDSFLKMEMYLEQGNYKEAYKCAHAIKGVAGNLSIDNLYTNISSFAEYLKNGQLQEARGHLKELKEVYELSMDTILTLMS